MNHYKWKPANSVGNKSESAFKTTKKKKKLPNTCLYFYFFSPFYIVTLKYYQRFITSLFSFLSCNLSFFLFERISITFLSSEPAFVATHAVFQYLRNSLHKINHVDGYYRGKCCLLSKINTKITIWELIFFSGPVAQRIEALSLCGSRWVLSEDIGFKSYPSRPEVYLVKKCDAIDNNYGRQ